MKKYILNFILFIIILAAGLRVFNHLHAWLGFFICACSLFPIYKLIKQIKDENED